METTIIQNPVEQTEAYKIEAIKEALKELSPKLIDSLYEYVVFLLEKEKKHKEFVERILVIEANPDYVEFDTAEDLVEAIVNWSE
ncbi:MAG: hypothetical protein L3V56_12735 [Candidatus Magnetoovum sp. WYHC-5]|nr:hypothetical protein [Candidatus Magnetoovum sp. WYHC-5]